jgi:phage protein U
MLGNVMMALGLFRFGMANEAYQNFTRRAAFRWDKVDRVGRAPALQYAGPDAQTVSLSGVIYPHFRGGLRQVDLMRARAETGEPMMMVDGLGWVLADGAPQKIEFSMKLQAYGEDRL